MKYYLFLAALLACWALQVQAQEATPATDPYNVGGIQIDMSVSSPQAARDEALIAAQKQAYAKLKEQLPESHLPNTADGQLNKLMQNFEVAGEKISAKRYIGTFTIRFRPNAVQSLAGGVPMPSGQGTAYAAPMGSGNMTVTYRFRSLPDWAETERRLKSVQQISQRAIKTIGRGYVTLDIAYMGTPESLNMALQSQNMALQNDTGGTMQLVRRDAVL